MLEQAGVTVTPGVDFDPFNGKNFIRLSYAGSESEMHEAIDRIGRWLKR
jgi:aspartate/methionine/tyrosine aminotransferase